MLIAPVLKNSSISCTVFQFFNMDSGNDFSALFHPIFRFYGCSTLAVKQTQTMTI